MIEVKLQFSIDEAVALFRESGLEVTQLETTHIFRAPNEITYEEDLLTWVVLNPNTNEHEPLLPYFMEFIKQRKKDLFLTAEKLQLFNLFKK